MEARRTKATDERAPECRQSKEEARRSQMAGECELECRQPEGEERRTQVAAAEVESAGGHRGKSTQVGREAMRLRLE